MKFVWGFAYITLKENVRRWSFYGVALAYLLSLVFARILMEFSLQDLTKFFFDIAFSFLSFFVITSTLFLSTDIMTKDFEKKAIFTILSKGLSRNKYILGRAIGLTFFTLILTFLLGAMFGVFSELINTSISDNYRKDIVFPLLVLAIFHLWIKASLLSIVVLFFASFMVTPFLIFLASVVVYIAGSSVENLYYFVTFNEDKVSPIVKTGITVLFYAFPNFSVLNPDIMLGMEKLDVVKLGLDLLKTLIYGCTLLTASMLLFNKREIT